MLEQMVEAHLIDHTMFKEQKVEACDLQIAEIEEQKKEVAFVASSATRTVEAQRIIRPKTKAQNLGAAFPSSVVVPSLEAAAPSITDPCFESGHQVIFYTLVSFSRGSPRIFGLETYGLEAEAYQLEEHQDLPSCATTVRAVASHLLY